MSQPTTSIPTSIAVAESSERRTGSTTTSQFGDTLPVVRDHFSNLVSFRENVSNVKGLGLDILAEDGYNMLKNEKKEHPVLDNFGDSVFDELGVLPLHDEIQYLQVDRHPERLKKQGNSNKNFNYIMKLKNSGL